MLRLEIVTPERKVLSETVDMVTIPTASGEIGVLPNHAPLISSLKPGILTYTHGSVSGKLVIASGFVEINDNKVSVLADIAETADEIDVEKARLQKEELERLLSKWSGSEEDFEKEKEKLDCAQARLQLATGKIS
jgi:F-type H+-transporting ATPase subunit epsilon